MTSARCLGASCGRSRLGLLLIPFTINPLQEGQPRDSKTSRTPCLQFNDIELPFARFALGDDRLADFQSLGQVTLAQSSLGPCFTQEPEERLVGRCVN